MTLLEILIKIRDEGPVRPMSGICASVYHIGTHDLVSEFKRLAKRWPKCSGVFDYPVPDPGGVEHPARSYGTYRSHIWNPDHPYGALRLELLNWCIEQLSQKETV